MPYGKSSSAWSPSGGRAEEVGEDLFEVALALGHRAAPDPDDRSYRGSVSRQNLQRQLDELEGVREQGGD